LGELGETLNGLTYSPKDIVEENEGILVLRSSNIQNDSLVFDDNVFVKSKNLKYNPVELNDILICVRNGSKSLIGKNALITEEAKGVAFGAFMSIYRSELNSYLYHCFKSDIYQNHINKNLGATINSINGSDLKQFSFPLPPLPEQQKIAEILSTWDKAIQETNAIIKKLEERNNALAFSLLTGKRRVKGFEEKWDNHKLEYFFEEYSLKPDSKLDLPVFTSSKNGLMNQSDYYSGGRISSRENVDYNILPNGFITYRSRSDDGLFTFNKNNSGYDGLISGYYPVFKVVNGDDCFFLYYLNLFKRKLTKYSSGTSQLVLSFKALIKASFILPSLEEQIAIAEILNTANQELKQYQDKLETLKQQKKGLMQQLLTGK